MRIFILKFAVSACMREGGWEGWREGREREREYIDFKHFQN